MKLASTTLRLSARGAAYFLALVLLSIAIGSTIHIARPWPASWSVADWSSSGQLPPAEQVSEAMIRVYCARAGRWRGVLASHCWIVLKKQGARQFTRYDVVGWGTPVRRDNYPADGRWFGNPPVARVAISGNLAGRLIERIGRAVEAYPYRDHGDYVVVPGPNSNTFVAWIARRVPELGLELPPTAVGKDYLGSGFQADSAPSGSGWQVSYGGWIGAVLAYEEGFEIHFAGLTLGIDPFSLAVKLPSIGRIGLW